MPMRRVARLAWSNKDFDWPVRYWAPRCMVGGLAGEYVWLDIPVSYQAVGRAPSSEVSAYQRGGRLQWLNRIWTKLGLSLPATFLIPAKQKWKDLLYYLKMVGILLSCSTEHWDGAHFMSRPMVYHDISAHRNICKTALREYYAAIHELRLYRRN